MTAADLYREMTAYLTERGWQREGRYWTHDDFVGELIFGEAVGEQLMDEGVDTLTSPAGSPLREQAVDLARAEFIDWPAAKDAMVTTTLGLVPEPDDHRGET